jgi:hypothetical protein
MTQQHNIFGGADDIHKIKKLSNGYADHPGTGPEGETCGTCAHRVRVRKAKTYQKCDLVNWTNGKATDIKVATPACSKWGCEVDA